MKIEERCVYMNSKTYAQLNASASEELRKCQKKGAKPVQVEVKEIYGMSVLVTDTNEPFDRTLKDGEMVIMQIVDEASE